MMRITNSIIASNSKYNVNSNKVSVDTLNTQMTDQKKIHAPSEDPVIAIRALRLRGTLTQIDQYYTKNIPDALAWLDITETALINMKGIVSTVAKQCGYGANDPLEKADRKVILDELKEAQKQIYSEGNADYAGRTLFTGYKTGEYLTFQTDDLNTSYDITEKFTVDDLQDVTYINNEPAIEYGNVTEIMEADMSNSITYTRLSLGYNNITEPDPATPTRIYFTDNTGASTFIECEVKSLSPNPDDAYNISDADANKAYFIPETGELVLGKDAASSIRQGTDVRFSYTKTGFQARELRPEHYYDCTKTKDSAGDDCNIEYVKEPNEIDYTISFNQTININTEASGIFDSRMARSIDDMITNLQRLDDADKKIEDIEKMIKEPRFADETNQEKLKTMLNAAKKEKDLLDDKTQKLFEENIGVWQNYLDQVDLAITDCGSRYSRVELTQSRMESQQATFKKLKSTNEDREISDIIVDYTSAYTAYQSSLKATSKALQQTLLDYV